MEAIYLEIQGMKKFINEWGKHENYFYKLNYNKGLEAVKFKIEEILSKQGDYQK